MKPTDGNVYIDGQDYWTLSDVKQTEPAGAKDWISLSDNSDGSGTDHWRKHGICSKTMRQGQKVGY